MKKIRSSEDIPNDQYSLVITDVFTGQKTSEVLHLLNANKILVTNVPPNVTKYYLGVIKDWSVICARKFFLRIQFSK